MSDSGNAISLNRQLGLIFSLPFCRPGCNCNVRIWCGFFGTWDTFVGTKAHTRQQTEMPGSLDIWWSRTTMPWLNYQSLNNQEKQFMSRLYCCDWSLCILLLLFIGSHIVQSGFQLAMWRMTLNFWTSDLPVSTQALVFTGIIDVYYHAWVMQLWGLCPGLLVC